jgi:hypothetical protein
MYRARWRARLGPPAVQWGTAALIALAATPFASSAIPGAALAAVSAPAAASVDCASSPSAAARAAINRTTLHAASVAQRLSTEGEFAGRAIGLNVDGRALTIGLPVDSFVSAPDGDALLYGSAASGQSDIHLLDAASGCDQVVARLAGVARSAVLDPAGTALYVHGVTAAERHDMGVIRFALDGSTGEQVVPPLADDERFGPTFGTTLRWGTDGASLAVQSCGFESCRTRILEPASGSITTYDGPGQGALITLTPDTLVAFADCPGTPCPVIAIDRAGGAQRVMAAEAWSATPIQTEDGYTLAIDTAAGTIEVAP